MNADRNILITPLRRPSGLSCLVSVQAEEFTRPSPSDSLETVLSLPLFTLETRSVSSVASLHPTIRHINRVWEALEGVRSLNADALVNVLEILLVTQPAPDVGPLNLSLTCGQVDRAMRQIRSRLNLVRLQLLEDMALRRAARGLEVDPHDPPSKHALQVMMLLDTNRRILRRFMQAGASGQYLHDHSLNQEWLRSHPVVDGRLWTRGIHVQGDLDGELVTLALEGNPLEVLRMGTYPGSCLGLGGDFTYSAVAAMLDINKQVIYARNRRGKVIGRQLLAISQENTLVCFGVYPDRVPKKLKEMFVDYDRRFARALGMGLHDPDVDDECEIDVLIAEDWWDDGAWDLTSA